jgi:hypothetical protein
VKISRAQSIDAAQARRARLVLLLADGAAFGSGQARLRYRSWFPGMVGSVQH